MSFRELGENETPVKPSTTVLIKGESSDTVIITPNEDYVEIGSSKTYQLAPVEIPNSAIQNTVSAVLMDGRQFYPKYDPSYFGYNEQTGVYTIKGDGSNQQFTYNPATLQVNFINIQSAHTISAETIRAIGVNVKFNSENGVIVPNGEVWWPVNASGQPEDLTLYVAPKSGYELESFKVNSQNRQLVDDAAADNQVNNWSAPKVEPMAANSLERQVQELARIKDNAAAKNTYDAVKMVSELFNVEKAWAASGTYAKAQAYKLTSADIPTDLSKSINVEVEATWKQIGSSSSSSGSSSSGSNNGRPGGSDDPTSTYDVIVNVVGGNSGHGKIDLGGGNYVTNASVKVAAGAKKSFKFVADNVYYVSALTDNGRNVLSQLQDGTYTVQNVREKHAISVTFSRQIGTIVGAGRDVKYLQSLAVTGDLYAPIALGLFAVAMAAAGVLVFSRSRRRSEGRHSA